MVRSCCLELSGRLSTNLYLRAGRTQVGQPGVLVHSEQDSTVAGRLQAQSCPGPALAAHQPCALLCALLLKEAAAGATEHPARSPQHGWAARKCAGKAETVADTAQTSAWCPPCWAWSGQPIYAWLWCECFTRVSPGGAGPIVTPNPRGSRVTTAVMSLHLLTRHRPQ